MKRGYYNSARKKSLEREAIEADSYGMTATQMQITNGPEWVRFAQAIASRCPRFAADVELTVIEGECPMHEFDRIGRSYRAWLCFDEIPSYA